MIYLLWLGFLFELPFVDNFLSFLYIFFPSHISLYIYAFFLGLFELYSLTRLDLRGNRLSYVSRDVFSSLVRLRFLDLSDNPLVISRADAERLRHLTAVVKVIITTVPHEKVSLVPIVTGKAIEWRERKRETSSLGLKRRRKIY